MYVFGWFWDGLCFDIMQRERARKREPEQVFHCTMHMTIKRNLNLNYIMDIITVRVPWQ